MSIIWLDPQVETRADSWLQKTQTQQLSYAFTCGPKRAD